MLAGGPRQLLPVSALQFVQVFVYNSETSRYLFRRAPVRHQIHYTRSGLSQGRGKHQCPGNIDETEREKAATYLKIDRMTILEWQINFSQSIHPLLHEHLLFYSFNYSMLIVQISSKLSSCGLPKSLKEVRTASVRFFLFCVWMHCE